MNHRIQFVCVVGLLLASASAFATPVLTQERCNDYPFVQANGPLTRQQIRNELVDLEAVGYNPAAQNDVNYPDQLLEALQRLWRQYAADCTPQ